MQISPFVAAVTSQAERHSRRRRFVGFYLVFGTVCMCIGMCVCVWRKFGRPTEISTPPGGGGGGVAAAAA